MIDNWNKMDCKERSEVIESWPEDKPFFTDTLILDGDLKVDEWRDSHYDDQIGVIPENIGKLKNIKQLSLKNQQLKSLPESLFDLENLEVLDLEDNELEELADGLLMLKNLKVLNLRGNYRLKRIPDLAKLANLEDLVIVYTSIDSFSEDFYKLKNIKRIDVEQSKLEDTDSVRKLMKSFSDALINHRVGKAIKIEDDTNPETYKGKEVLYIKEYHLKRLPENLFEADLVKKLEINSVYLEYMPDRFDRLKTVETLIIKADSIETLPPSIFKMPSLKTLELNCRSLKDLSEDIEECVSLENLRIEGGNLSKLPDSISKLTTLKSIFINDLCIPELNLSTLTNLESLWFERFKVGVGKEFKIDSRMKALKKLEKVVLELDSGFIKDELFNLPESVMELNIKIVKYRPDEPLESEFFFDELLRHFKNLERTRIEKVKLQLSEKGLPKDHPVKAIDFSGCRFELIPDSISNLENLNRFYLFECGLKEVNAALYDCSQLKYLYLQSHDYKTIPDGIEKLKNLTRLVLNYCPIEKLPEGIFSLPALVDFEMRDCLIMNDREFMDRFRETYPDIELEDD